MKKIRVTIRAVYLPASPWISLTPINATRLSTLGKLFNFQAKGTCLQTIEFWRSIVADAVAGTLKEEVKEMPTPPGFETIQLKSHPAKQIWRYVELLKDDRLQVIPFYSLQAKHAENRENLALFTHLVQFYPASPVIIKSTITPSEDDLSQALKELKAFHRRMERHVTEELFPLLTDPASPYFINSHASLLKRTGDVISYLKLQRLKKSLVAITDIEPLSLSFSSQTPMPAFNILTSQSKPRNLRNNIETIIDWYLAYRAILPWLKSQIYSAENWGISEFVYYYSLIAHVFNPAGYSSSTSQGSTAPRLVRTKPLRRTWDYLIKQNPAAINAWNEIHTLFAEVIRPNPLFFKKILDPHAEAYISRAITLDLTHHPLASPKTNNSGVMSSLYPLLCCREATVFTLFLGIANAFIGGPLDKKFAKYLCDYSEKLEQQINWETRFLVPSRNIKGSLLKNLDHIGWVRTNVIRHFLCYENKRETIFPYRIFEKIKTGEPCTPVLKAWSPSDFTPVPGNTINRLVNMRLLEMKKETKSVLLRANTKHPYVKAILSNEELETNNKKEEKEERN